MTRPEGMQPDQARVWDASEELIKAMDAAYPYRPGTNRPTIDGARRALHELRQFANFFDTPDVQKARPGHRTPSHIRAWRRQAGV